MAISDLEKVNSRRIIKVKVIMFEDIAEFFWDGERVKLKMLTESGDFARRMSYIYHKDNFFNPHNDSIEGTDAIGNFDLFLTKAIPEIVMAGFSYRLIYE